MAVKKTKVKEWFTIVAPKFMDEREIGRTMAIEAEALVGRRIEVSAIEFTDDFSKYYMKFIFRIVKVENDKAFTEFDGSSCLRDYISRMVLRRVRRIDTVQDLVTKDSVKVRVKGLGIIGRRVKSSIQKVVGERMRKMIKATVEESTLENFIGKLLSDEIKNRMLQELRTTYPMRNFEIRKIEVLR